MPCLFHNNCSWPLRDLGSTWEGNFQPPVPTRSAKHLNCAAKCLETAGWMPTCTFTTEYDKSWRPMYALINNCEAKCVKAAFSKTALPGVSVAPYYANSKCEELFKITAYYRWKEYSNFPTPENLESDDDYQLLMKDYSKPSWLQAMYTTPPTKTRKQAEAEFKSLNCLNCNGKGAKNSSYHGKQYAFKVAFI